MAHQRETVLWNVTFAELTGIAPPTVVWRRNPEDGLLVEVDPDFEQLQERRREASLIGPSLDNFYTSFDGLVTCKDAEGKLLWTKQLASPALSLLAPTGDTTHVHQIPWSANLDDQSMVNVGNFGGTFFVLPQATFPRLSNDLPVWSGMLRLMLPKDESVQVEVDEVIPGVGQYDHPTWPLLPPMSDSSSQKLVWTLFAILLSLLALLYIFRRKPENPDGSAPPGFEDVSRGTAERIYASRMADEGPSSFVISDQILGYGSHGTVVFRGEFDGREVAVKRMLLDFYEMAGQEVSLLQSADHHPNVIRYYWREQTDRFMYICLELCPATLTDLLDNAELKAKVGTPRDVCKQLLSGIAHLHSLGIVHRDLKPGNILISKRGTVLISDFGLSRRLVGEESSFHPTMHTGTVGWRAPELLLSDEVVKLGTVQQLPRVNRSIDVWAAGCLIFYILTGGEHPFGDRLQREANITINRINLAPLADDPLALDLVTRMLRREASLRPSAAACLNHPWFWDASRCLAFLAACSDRLESEDRHSFPASRRLESLRSSVLEDGSWHQQLHPDLWADLSAFRRYSPHSLQDLLRAIRNKRSHLNELPPHLQQAIGVSAEDYWSYWNLRFPRLLITAYQVVEADERMRSLHPFSDDFCK